MTTIADDEQTYYGEATANGILSRMFDSCSDDPKSSIHRAWGLTLIFLVFFFGLSIFESTFVLSRQNRDEIMKMIDSESRHCMFLKNVTFSHSLLFA